MLASADSDRQTRAIADHVDGILSQTGSNPLSIEGKASSQWVLMDYGDVVVHIFRHDARQHYGLERLWADAKRIPVKEGTPSPAAAAKPARSKRIANSRRA